MTRLRRRSALTLLEMVISLTVLSVLVLAMSSAVVIASRALPAADDPQAVITHTTQVLGELTDDLRFAVTFTERTASAVTFTVADRGSPPDGIDDTIRWSWSGMGGESLTRQFNAEAPVVCAEDVYDFSLVYDTVVRPVEGVDTTFQTIVRAALQIGAAATGRVASAAPVLNQPEVTP